MTLLKRATALGHAAACFELGLYYQGKVRGLPEAELDDDTAARWYGKANDLGDYRGATNLAVLHICRLVSKPDEALAIELLDAAAERGDREAFRVLRFHFNGGTRDIREGRARDALAKLPPAVRRAAGLFGRIH